MEPRPVTKSGAMLEHRAAGANMTDSKQSVRAAQAPSQLSPDEKSGFFWGPPKTPEEAHIERVERLTIKNEKVMADAKAASEANLEAEKLRSGKFTAMPALARPEEIALEFAMDDTKTLTIEYLNNPWLPSQQVIGFYGRGESGKSSFAATLAAMGSEDFSTLWVSTEEPKDWIKKRHMEIGRQNATLAVPDVIVSHKDKDGRAMASSFNTYQHLEPTIQKAKQEFDAIHGGARPLRLVVLDTLVALTTWQKHESPNDDASTKRLLAYLLQLCQQYDVTIIVIGHSNKGKHEQLADTVAGSSAWVNSLRQAFIFIHDQSVEYHNVVCTVKGTLTGTFAAPYRTEPVHRLFKRADGQDSVLCRVVIGDVEWGRLASLALVDSALGRNQEDEADDDNDGAVRQAVTTVLERLQAETEPVSREMVHSLMGVKIHQRLWKKVEKELNAHPVRIVRGARGTVLYARK